MIINCLRYNNYFQVNPSISSCFQITHQKLTKQFAISPKVDYLCNIKYNT